jgi:hypothetical protein
VKIALLMFAAMVVGGVTSVTAVRTVAHARNGQIDDPLFAEHPLYNPRVSFKECMLYSIKRSFSVGRHLDSTSPNIVAEIEKYALDECTQLDHQKLLAYDATIAKYE